MIAVLITSILYLILGAIEVEGVSARKWMKNSVTAVLEMIENRQWERPAGADSENSISTGNLAGTVQPERDEAVMAEPEADGAISTEPEQENVNRDSETTGEENTYQAVTEDYVKDALFIGDSRTVGLAQYSGWEDTKFYAEKGLTIYKLFDMPIVEEEGNRQKLTIEEALQKYQFGKIYLMLGINEMGVGTVDTFMETYEQAVAHLRELQPDAILYLEGIIKVTDERSDKGDYINNPSIEERNERIAKLADNRDIFYLDANSVLCREDGGLIEDYTFDGVHLRAEYICVWTDFLLQNGIVK